jgi:hypothetical protein
MCDELQLLLRLAKTDISQNGKSLVEAINEADKSAII